MLAARLTPRLTSRLSSCTVVRGCAVQLGWGCRPCLGAAMWMVLLPRLLLGVRRGLDTQQLCD